jgi:hypothetical protein
MTKSIYKSMELGWVVAGLLRVSVQSSPSNSIILAFPVSVMIHPKCGYMLRTNGSQSYAQIWYRRDLLLPLCADFIREYGPGVVREYTPDRVPKSGQAKSRMYYERSAV